MKKIRNIIKHPITKRILFTLISIGILSLLSNNIMGGEVFAQDNSEPTFEESITKTTTLLDAALKILYIILYPLLWLAGLSLDNSLVYGSFFNLDAPLWKFWNIVKNFANFTLGFLVLWEIIKNLFQPNESAGKPFQVIKKTLIAGILIQASWFIFAALIDLSTVATYAIGGMPLSIIGETELAKKPLIGSASKLDLDNLDMRETINAKDFTVCGVYKHTNGVKYYIPPCKRDNNIIIGQDDVSCQEYESEGDVLENVCTPGGARLVGLTHCPEERAAMEAAEEGSTEYINAQDELELCIELEADMAASIGGYKINTNDSAGMKIAQEEGLSNLADAVEVSPKELKTLSDILKGSKGGMIGPLTTIYSSILDFTSIAHGDIQVKGSIGVAIEMIIKLAFSIALLLPLLLMTIILFKRVLYLWMLISISPFIVLMATFDKLKEKMSDMKALQLGNIMKTIFAPVFIVFSLSISVIFLQAISHSINNVYSDPNESNKVGELFGVKKVPDKENSRDFEGGNRITIEGDSPAGYGSARDMISWFMINLFAIGIVWALLFATIQFTSPGGQWVDNIQKGVQKKLGQIPIIPIPTEEGGFKGVGVGSAQTIANQKLEKMANTKVPADQMQAINSFLNKDDDTSKENAKASEVEQVMLYNQIKNEKGVNAAEEILGTDTVNKIKSYDSFGNIATTTGIDKYMKEGTDKIDPMNVIKMNKTDVLNALNGGHLELAGGTGIVTQSGAFEVVQHNGTNGDWFDLVPVGEEDDANTQLENLKENENLTEDDLHKAVKSIKGELSDEAKEEINKKVQDTKDELKEQYGATLGDHQETAP